MAAVAEKSIGAEDQFIRRQTPAEVEYHSDVMKLVDLLSKLNPAAKEFFPSNFSSATSAAGGSPKPNGRLSADAPVFVASTGFYGNGLISNGGSSKDSSSDGSSNNQPNRRVIFFYPSALIWFWLLMVSLLSESLYCTGNSYIRVLGLIC